MGAYVYKYFSFHRGTYFPFRFVKYCIQFILETSSKNRVSGRSFSFGNNSSLKNTRNYFRDIPGLFSKRFMAKKRTLLVAKRYPYRALNCPSLNKKA